MVRAKADQYRHPHESRRSMVEVTQWFNQAGIDLLLTIPPAGGEMFTEETRLFEQRPLRRNLDYVLTEAEMLLTGGQDGGLFMMVGRKRS